MVYIPNTDAEREEMLRTIGVERIADLFHDVPEPYRNPRLNLPQPLSEAEILAELRDMSEANADLDHVAIFLGAGSYHHFVPSVVDMVISRSEFYTAYTPYQPEVSQGVLQSLFEYQSMICALTEMDVANSSHYDGATATAEAVIMALNVHRRKRKRVVMSPTVHPMYRQTVYTYTQGMNLTIVGEDAPRHDLQALADLIDDDTCCVIVQNPDFLGRMFTPQEMQALADAAHAHKALFVVVIDPISLGFMVPPGRYDADIVVGEGQSLGSLPQFGGPYLGIFAFKKEYVRKSSGRLVGETVDAEGKRGYVITLSTREQHIRREKATSNICTNEALVAIAAAVYMASMGKEGLRRVAELSYHKAHYAAKRIAEIEGFEVLSSWPFFKEFVVKCPAPVQEINDYLIEEWGIIGGYDLSQDYPDLENAMLLCVTEMNDREEIDALISAFQEIAGGALESSVKFYLPT
ncbi:MAG: aminomethyl-transferring glycine dehydrogenase subunit GcvPA [Chloroflexi bacterium]|nr:aminomethyl-transferring glycine dehydrogenase subunit GcvPA [Chloroflexota bacterium]